MGDCKWLMVLQGGDCAAATFDDGMYDCETSERTDWAFDVSEEFAREHDGIVSVNIVTRSLTWLDDSMVLLDDLSCRYRLEHIWVNGKEMDW